MGDFSTSEYVGRTYGLRPYVMRTENFNIGPQIPKLDTATRIILKFDTAACHNLKINM